ncbi:MAG: hypothetical protein ACKOXF_12495 [Chitinophagaceae bacterium]
MLKLMRIPLLLLLSVIINHSTFSQELFIGDTIVSADINIAQLNQLDSVDKSVRVFLGGENHNYWSENNLIELKMIKHLHKTRGVRNLVIELGYARGYLLDRYINDDSTYYVF